MTTKDTLALALDALEQIQPSGLTTPYVVRLRARAITAIKQAQEPVEARVPLTGDRITELYNEACADWKNRYDRPVVFARAIEAAILAKLVPLTDDECDKLAAQTMDRIADAKGMHALDLNPNILEHHTLRRELIRAGTAHGIQAKGGQQ